MHVVFAGNTFSDGNTKSFSIGTNLAPSFELGSKAGQDTWLEAMLVGPDEEPLSMEGCISPQSFRPG